jgi:hypothetical protein
MEFLSVDSFGFWRISSWFEALGGFWLLRITAMLECRFPFQFDLFRAEELMKRTISFARELHKYD